jgi:hypothetical protein
MHKTLIESKSTFDEQAHRLSDDLLGFFIDYVAETTKRARETVRIDWDGEFTSKEH